VGQAGEVGLFELIEALDEIVRRASPPPLAPGPTAAGPAGSAKAAPDSEAPPAPGEPARGAGDLKGALVQGLIDVAGLAAPLVAVEDVARGIVDVVLRVSSADRALLVLRGEAASEPEIRVGRDRRGAALDDLPGGVSVPVGRGRDAIGSIAVEGTRLGAAELDALRALAQQAAASLRTARELARATADPLTSLLARPHFRRLLEDAAGRAREGPRVPFAVLLLDVDDFKLVNERHGHAAGDQVLREMGAVLRSAVRPPSACCRYGGETFAVLLPGAGAAAAAEAAEKVRAAVVSRRFAEPRLRVTVSVGFAAAPEQGRDPDEVLRRADQALFRAKATKDKACGYTPEIGPAAERRDRLAGVLTGDFARDHDRVRTLLETIAAVNAARDLGELLTVAVDRFVEATGAERGALMLAEGPRRRLGTVVARDRRGRALSPAERFSRTIPERVLAAGRPVCLVDAFEGDGGGDGEGGGGARPAAGDAGAPSHSVAELNLRTVVCVPLATKDRPLGVLYADSRTGPRSGGLEASNLPFFEGLARQVALAIENARLKARLAYEGGAIEV